VANSVVKQIDLHAVLYRLDHEHYRSNRLMRAWFDEGWRIINDARAASMISQAAKLRIPKGLLAQQQEEHIVALKIATLDASQEHPVYFSIRIGKKILYSQRSTEHSAKWIYLPLPSYIAPHDSEPISLMFQVSRQAELVLYAIRVDPQKIK